VTPTVPVVAPAIDGPIDGMRILRNTWPFNAVRGPAISVPCGRGAGGLPVGLQIVAAPDREALLLRVAAAVEAPGR
jgi:Asp-tRNA(Asn)/Glu-tRNA(Gln) amidotransferase A subunit family amidase